MQKSRYDQGNNACSKHLTPTSAPSCNHFGRHGEWKKYLATKILTVVANWRPTYYKRNLGPVHKYSEIFVSAIFFMRIHLASTHVCRIRSVYPEISVQALQSGDFHIRCVSGYVWTLVSVYFCIRWCHRLSFLCNAHALLTNPLRCPDTNRIRVDGHIRFVYTMCGRRYFCIRIKKFADTRISGYV